MRIIEIVENTTRAFGGAATVEFLRGLPTVWNDPDLTDELEASYEQGAGGRILHLAEPFSGSDDFGVMSHTVPSTFFLLGCTPAGAEEIPLHNPTLVLDENALVEGAALFAAAATGWLTRHAQSE